MAAITNFTHHYGEELGDAWKRFNQLIRRCPNHGESGWKLLNYFYMGLHRDIAMELDRMAEGSFMSLDEQRAYHILNTVANRETTRSDLCGPRRSQVDPEVQSQLDAMSRQITTVLHHIQQMERPQKVEPPPQSADNEAMALALAHITDLLGTVHNRLKACEAQVSENAEKMEALVRPTTTPTPAAPIHAITTRSGLATMDPPYPSHARAEATKATEKELEKLIPVPTVVPSPKDTSGRSEEKKEVDEDWLKGVPFPQRLKKVNDEEQFKRFVQMFKQLHINIPFAEAISQMPKYAKFLKEILTNKRRIEEVKVITMTEECSALIQKALPPKMKDPGRFLIPVTLGTYHGKALCDLGASINLMPTSIFKKLGMGKPTPTILRLQMADRSIKRARGILEDVLVRAGDLIFPTDFVIMDMEADDGAPLILGRPFLATGKANIDVVKGELTLHVEDEKVTFNVFEPIDSTPIEYCYRMDEYPFDDEEVDERMMQEIRDDEDEEGLQWTLLELEEDMKNNPEWYATSGRSKLPLENQRLRTRKKRKNWEPMAWHPKGKEKRPLDPNKWNEAEDEWGKNKYTCKEINLADKFFPPWFDVH